MAYCWKTEYYVYEGDDAVAWCDSLDEARTIADTNEAVTRIDEVRHYLDDTDTVWERDA